MNRNGLANDRGETGLLLKRQENIVPKLRGWRFFLKDYDKRILSDRRKQPTQRVQFLLFGYYKLLFLTLN